MEKPALLRSAIERHLPEIKQNPEKLAMFVTGGRIIANKGTLSHETEYTLSSLITDFSGDIDVLHTVIITWLQEHYPYLLGAGQVDAKGFTFEVDILSDRSADVLIEMKLMERTVALVDDAGRIAISHPDYPKHIKDLTSIIGAEM